MMYFVRSTPETGAELWKSDGTTLIKEIHPGSSGSYHTSLASTLHPSGTFPSNIFSAFESHPRVFATSILDHAAFNTESKLERNLPLDFDLDYTQSVLDDRATATEALDEFFADELLDQSIAFSQQTGWID